MLFIIFFSEIFILVTVKFISKLLKEEHKNIKESISRKKFQT